MDSEEYHITFAGFSITPVESNVDTLRGVLYNETYVNITHYRYSNDNYYYRIKNNYSIPANISLESGTYFIDAWTEDVTIGHKEAKLICRMEVELSTGKTITMWFEPDFYDEKHSESQLVLVENIVNWKGYFVLVMSIMILTILGNVELRTKLDEERLAFLVLFIPWLANLFLLFYFKSYDISYIIINLLDDFLDMYFVVFMVMTIIIGIYSGMIYSNDKKARKLTGISDIYLLFSVLFTFGGLILLIFYPLYTTIMCYAPTPIPPPSPIRKTSLMLALSVKRNMIIEKLYRKGRYDEHVYERLKKI